MLRRASVRASRLAIRQRHPPHQGPRSVSGRRRRLSSRAKRSRQETHRRLCGSRRPRRDTARHQRRGRNSRAVLAKRLLFSIRSRRLMLPCWRFRSCPKRSLCCRSQSSWMWRSPLAASVNCLERVTVRRVDVTLASMRRTISSRSDTTLLPSLPTAGAKGAKRGSECQGRPPVRARDPSMSKGHVPLLESKR